MYQALVVLNPELVLLVSYLISWAQCGEGHRGRVPTLFQTAGI